MSNKRNALRLRPDQNRDVVDAAIDATEIAYQAKLANYTEPTTAQEWWDVLKAWWPEIVAIWYEYVPDIPLDPDVLLHMRRTRHEILEAWCHRAWSNAPDNGVIHAHPGWGVLCDLCSEAGVLVDDDTFERIPVPDEVVPCNPENAVKLLSKKFKF